MRTLRKNKQRFYYSLYEGSKTIYEPSIDDYIDEQGNRYPIEAGEEKPYYSEPKEFRASISSRLNELHAREYGVDQSSIYSELCVDKGYMPSDFTFGALVWKDTPIVYEDANKTIPDASSADYVVKGMLTEFINNDWYLLQRNNNG